MTGHSKRSRRKDLSETYVAYATAWLRTLQRCLDSRRAKAEVTSVAPHPCEIRSSPPSDPVSSPSPSLPDVLGEHPPSPAPGRAWLSRGPLSSSRAALKSPSPRGPLYRTSCNCCCHCPNLRSLFLPPPQRLAVMIRVCSPLPPPPPTAWLHAGGLCSPRHEDSTSQTCLLDPRSRFSHGHRTAPPPSTSGRQRKMVKQNDEA